MQTHTHTNGPWFRTVRQCNEETIYEICTAAENGEPKEIIARVNHCVITPGLSISDEVRANARLIAAAPDLLCMLERVLDGVLRLPEIPRTLCSLDIEQARKAIAKAKGDE